MNSVSPQKSRELKSQTTVDVRAEKSKIFSWRPEKAADENAGEEIFKSFDKKLLTDKDFVRNDYSPRKLYQHRPAALRAMNYGQFACQYRKLDPSQRGYKKAYEECNKSKNSVGPDSDFQLVGVNGKAAPTSMMLGNGAVMKLRENKPALPILPRSENFFVTDMLLFGDWQTSDEVSEEGELSDTPLKTEQRRTARLELFPKMTYE